MRTRTIDSTMVRLLVALVLVWTASAVQAGIDVKIDHDKKFDFSTAQTWTWRSPEPGEVKMARTQEDDPEAMRKRAEPVILSAVANEMTKRGLKQAAQDAQFTVTYYLLLSINSSAQTVGQFLPAVTQWGLPPYAAATQSLEIMNRGSLVLDIGTKDKIVWRGVAQANVKIDSDDRKREATIREAVRDLLRKFPPKN